MTALKRHLWEKVPISDLCDELGIAPKLVHRWQRELIEIGYTAFESEHKSKAVESGKDQNPLTGRSAASHSRR